MSNTVLTTVEAVYYKGDYYHAFEVQLMSNWISVHHPNLSNQINIAWAIDTFYPGIYIGRKWVAGLDKFFIDFNL